MRTLRLPDDTTWQLETVQELSSSDDRREEHHAPRPGARRAHRTFVWVRCVGPGQEFRLMFAAAWELWPDATLVSAIVAERDRLASVPRAG